MSAPVCPALFVAAPASGQGKTTVTAALARLHRRQGRQVRVFKCGPDFLDPQIHAVASGAPVYNLDLGMCGEADAAWRLHEAAGEAVARAVSRSNLFKTAVFGNDPNWGRVLSEVGTVPATTAPYDPGRVDVSINGVMVCRGGGVGEARELVDMTPRECHVLIDLHAGDARVTLWTNDLTHDYVHENSAYSS